MELSVTTSHRDGGISVVAVGGEVDVTTAAQLRQALDAEVTTGRVRLVVDLEGVTFIDSTGLGVLVGRLKLVRHQSGWLRVVCSTDRILRVFQITGLDKVFGIHRSLDDALAA
ncbi:MAG: STAS domain-containing protein [Dermatophilaceae bacterium]